MDFLAHEKKELKAKPSHRLSATEAPVSGSTGGWAQDGNSEIYLISHVCYSVANVLNQCQHFRKVGPDLDEPLIFLSLWSCFSPWMLNFEETLLGINKSLKSEYKILFRLSEAWIKK